MSRSKVKVTGTKNEKVRHFVRELSSGVRSSASSMQWENQHMLSGLLVIFVHCHICVTVRQIQQRTLSFSETSVCWSFSAALVLQSKIQLADSV